MVNPLFIANSFLHPYGPVAQVERAFIRELTKDKTFEVKIACSDFWNSEWDNMQLFRIHESVFKRAICVMLRRIGCTDWINRPDIDWLSWGKSAIEILYSYACKQRFDYIHSFSLSCSNHLVALELKRELGIPVVAQFFDPWYDNPYRPIKSKKLKEADYRMEEKVAEYADVIIHDNEVITKVWHDRYGDSVKDKIFTLPLVFSVPDIQVIRDKSSLTFGKKIIVSHIGNLNASRNLIDFIDGLSLLVNKYPNIRNSIHVNFVGFVPDFQKKYVEDLHLNDCVTFLGVVTEQECLNYYANSDIFLATDPINELDVYFPSKLMKYFYFGKPIIGITPLNSVMDKELRLSNNYSFRHHEKEKIADLLHLAIMGDKQMFNQVDKEYWYNFLPSNVVQEYINILRYKKLL